MSGDKVLILSSLGSDYGAYFVSRGFVRLLGVERVRQWPYKHADNGGRDTYPERVNHKGEHLQVRDGKVVYGAYFSGSEIWAKKEFWRFWDPQKNVDDMSLPKTGPVAHEEPLGIWDASDTEIFDMLHGGEFGLVVLNGCRWHGSAALHELQATFGDKLPPVVVIDHDDYTQRRWDFTDAFKPAVYFKRSLITPPGHPSDFMYGYRPEVAVRPFPFSSMWAGDGGDDIPWVPWSEREVDVFCIFGTTQVMRQKLKEITVEFVSKRPGVRIAAALGHAYQHPEYLGLLSRSKIVIDHQGFGTDTLRFWEAATAGCCIITDFHLETPGNSLLPGTHFLQYDNDTSGPCDKQDFVRYMQLLNGAVAADSEVETVARQMYEEIRRNHRNVDRARYIIDEVRKTGHALGGLP